MCEVLEEVKLSHSFNVCRLSPTLPQMKALPCSHTVQPLPLLSVRYSYEYVEETLDKTLHAFQ
jgi:hypothetical protein